MTHDFNTIYDLSLRALYFDLNKAEATHPDSDTVNLARTLINHARNFEDQKIATLLSKKFNGRVIRDFENPSMVTEHSVVDQPWSDPMFDPLKNSKEVWNAGRRASNTGIAYGFDEHGFPINPYGNYGVRGRGAIGRYGPNHAVDMGILRVMENEQGRPTLHALGIIRKDNNLPALCGGFTNFVKDEKGQYPYTREVMIETQTHEFFEEMISGSITLLPEYEEGLADSIVIAILKREITEKASLTDRARNMIAAQITTERKLKQVEEKDPAFLSAIRHEFENAHMCFDGPVLSSGRNTNNAWMETRLSWFMLDDAKWGTIKDDNDYDFIAGDDAANVLWHEITPELIKNSTESHSSLFVYLLSSYLLNADAKDQRALDGVKLQARALIDFFTPPVKTAPKTAPIHG